MNIVLKETNRRQKSLHDFLGANNDIRTIGIISPENPMGVALTSQENNKRVEKFKSYLQNNKIRFQKVKGRYNTNKQTQQKKQDEHSFLLFNVTVDELKFYGYSFDQESFIFGRFNDNSKKINFEYYQKEVGETPYQLLDKCDGFIRRDNADNFYTLLSKNFKFKIPFSIFESIVYNIHNRVEYRKNTSSDYNRKYEFYMERSLNENLTTQSRVLARSILYGAAWAPYDKREEMIKEENEILRLSGCSNINK